MDIEFSIDVPAADVGEELEKEIPKDQSTETPIVKADHSHVDRHVSTVTTTVKEAEHGSTDHLRHQDAETLVVDVDVDHSHDDHHMSNVSTTETVMDVHQTFDVDELPEDVRQQLLHGMGKSNVTVVIDGEERELPPGVTLESLSEEAMSAMVPGTEDGCNMRVVEVTETYITEDGGDDGEGHSHKLVVTTQPHCHEEGDEGHSHDVAVTTHPHSHEEAVEDGEGHSHDIIVTTHPHSHEEGGKDGEFHVRNVVISSSDHHSLAESDQAAVESHEVPHSHEHGLEEYKHFIDRVVEPSTHGMSTFRFLSIVIFHLQKFCVKNLEETSVPRR